ncbi:hypothetical protein HF086_004567 [Spodoptera exigua]|uniref:Very-long-chain 3-oxoacyl-CoA synthase n=1 Tax=Spodoptera exigua TaxID=7107 RepID=A0A922SE49_SPOEX|nr:hypothetical protein HF086_004567 [Spodoptera exigua]
MGLNVLNICFSGGHGIMLGFINSMVHAVMYSYYLISIVRPQWVRQWWKKYITQLQIVIAVRHPDLTLRSRAVRTFVRIPEVGFLHVPAA